MTDDHLVEGGCGTGEDEPGEGDDTENNKQQLPGTSLHWYLLLGFTEQGKNFLRIRGEALPVERVVYSCYA
jgi:hypothetical protein